MCGDCQYCACAEKKIGLNNESVIKFIEKLALEKNMNTDQIVEKILKDYMSIREIHELM